MQILPLLLACFFDSATGVLATAVFGLGASELMPDGVWVVPLAAIDEPCPLDATEDAASDGLFLVSESLGAPAPFLLPFLLPFFLLLPVSLLLFSSTELANLKYCW